MADIVRPDWGSGGENRSNAVVTAAPSPEQVIREVATSDFPSLATQQLVTPTASVPVVLEKIRDDRGNIIRPDWSRNDRGQSLSKSDAELRAQWQKEGGFEQNMQRVMSVQAEILARSSDAAALSAHVEKLPADIQRKAADVMRLTTAYGPEGGALKFEQFLNSLSTSEFDTFHTWWRGLSRGDQDCILATISRP
jgi:hypothetical protein